MKEILLLLLLLLFREQKTTTWSLKGAQSEDTRWPANVENLFPPVAFAWLFYKYLYRSSNVSPQNWAPFVYGNVGSFFPSEEHTIVGS